MKMTKMSNLDVRSLIAKHMPPAQAILQTHLLKVAECSYSAIISNHGVYDDSRSCYTYIPGAAALLY